MATATFTSRYATPKTLKMLSLYAVDDQVEARGDGVDATTCRKLENTLRVGISLAEVLLSMWSNGAKDDRAEWAEMERLMELWREPCAQMYQQIAALKAVGLSASGAEQFRIHDESILAILSEIDEAAAVIERRVGLRDVVLSPEAAEQFEQMLEEARERKRRALGERSHAS